MARIQNDYSIPHIDQARGRLDQFEHDRSHPDRHTVLLDGILHALLALHEQAEPKPTRTRTTTPKAADK